MQKVKKDYEKNKNKNKAEGKRLCDLQHIEFLKFYDVIQKETDEEEFHPHGGSLQRDDKVKHITLTPVKSMSCTNLLLSKYLAFSHIFISP